MAYDGQNPFKMGRALHMKGGAESITLTGARTLTRKDSQYLRIDPGGADRTVTLPAEETNEGLFFFVKNDAAGADETITLANDAAGTVATINDEEWVLVAVTGSDPDDTPAWIVVADSVGIGTVAQFPDSGGLYWGADRDASLIHDGTTGLDLTLTSNDAVAFTALDGTGDIFVIDTTTGDLSVRLVDGVDLEFGAGSDDKIAHDGTNTSWIHVTGDLTFDNQLVTGSTIFLLGTDTTATDFQVQNNSAAALLTVTPGSATGGTVVASGLAAKSEKAAAITGATTLTARDSGGVFSVAKTSAYAIALPTPAQGLRFKFMMLDTGAFAVTISNGSAHLFGQIQEAGTIPIAMTGTTITCVATQAVGDWLEFEGIDATHYLVTGSSITASKFTVA